MKLKNGGECIASFEAAHVTLGTRIGAVRKTLEHEFSWDEARIALVELRAALDAHFTMEENGGYLAEVRKHAPERILAVASLESDHSRMRGMLARLLAEVLVARSREPLREGVAQFLATLADHERRENELVAAAFSTDIPATD